eukprot:15436338-Alexandrium_andersonii.AAC.1
MFAGSEPWRGPLGPSTRHLSDRLGVPTYDSSKMRDRCRRSELELHGPRNGLNIGPRSTGG